MDINDLKLSLQSYHQDLGALEKATAKTGKIRARCKIHNRSNPEYRMVISKIREKRLIEFVSTNNTEEVLRLLQQGVSPNAKDLQKRSALHIAVTRNYKDIVEMLLGHGANPNQQDSIGNTALHLAACTRHLEIVTLLIKYGASTLVTDRNGLHPLGIAYTKLKHTFCEKSRPKTMSNDELSAYHNTIISIYNLILHHFDIQKSEAEYIDFKNKEEKFKEVNTKEEMDNEVLSLLESLEKFTFSKNNS